jgi:hypothetical protein
VGHSTVLTVYVLFLNPNGTVKSSQEITNGKGGLPSGTVSGNVHFGRHIANLGDVDGERFFPVFFHPPSPPTRFAPMAN